MNYQNVIRVPYTTLPNFERYRGPLFRDPPSEAHVAEKKATLADDENLGRSWFETPVSAARKLPEKLADRLGLGELCRKKFGPNAFSIKDLALLLQEDVAIIHRGKLEACCFMFPSGWAPETKVGMNFAELHAPVADGERLRASGDGITALMCRAHSYHRYVWGLAASPRLSAHPRYKHETPPPISPADIWFRYEHQITIPVDPGKTSAFIVNVQVIPYLDLSEAHRERILESIATMTSRVIAYKGLAPFKAVLSPA